MCSWLSCLQLGFLIGCLVEPLVQDEWWAASHCPSAEWYEHLLRGHKSSHTWEVVHLAQQFSVCPSNGCDWVRFAIEAVHRFSLHNHFDHTTAAATLLFLSALGWDLSIAGVNQQKTNHLQNRRRQRNHVPNTAKGLNEFALRPCLFRDFESNAAAGGHPLPTMAGLVLWDFANVILLLKGHMERHSSQHLPNALTVSRVKQLSHCTLFSLSHLRLKWTASMQVRLPTCCGGTSQIECQPSSSCFWSLELAAGRPILMSATHGGAAPHHCSDRRWVLNGQSWRNVRHLLLVLGVPGALDVWIGVSAQNLRSKEEPGIAARVPLSLWWFVRELHEALQRTAQIPQIWRVWTAHSVAKGELRAFSKKPMARHAHDQCEYRITSWITWTSFKLPCRVLAARKWIN